MTINEKIIRAKNRGWRGKYISFYIYPCHLCFRFFSGLAVVCFYCFQAMVLWFCIWSGCIHPNPERSLPALEIRSQFWAWAPLTLCACRQCVCCWRSTRRHEDKTSPVQDGHIFTNRVKISPIVWQARSLLLHKERTKYISSVYLYIYVCV